MFNGNLKIKSGTRTDLRCRTNHRRSAFTLVELVVSILLIMVMSTGALSYQYYSTRDVKHAEVQTTASRLALLLLESWKGDWGDTDFDPEISLGSDITINSSVYGPEVPNDHLGFPFVSIGSYEVLVDDVYYYVTLSYDDSFFNIYPRMLNASVVWQRNYMQTSADFTGDEPGVKFSTFIVEY